MCEVMVMISMQRKALRDEVWCDDELVKLQRALMMERFSEPLYDDNGQNMLRKTFDTMRQMWLTKDMATGIHMTWMGNNRQGTWSMLVTQDEPMGDVMERLRRRTNSIQLVSGPPRACPYFEVWERRRRWWPSN